MLQELSVRGYALLDNVNAPFEEGFNALTGETGAGKSLLAGALSLLLGEKSDASFIRAGLEEAEVGGLLYLKQNSEATDWLAQHHIALDEGQLLIKRLIKLNGRGAIYLQDQLVTREELRELATLLFDMHGQHEHQSLYQKDNHRKILDKAAGLEKEVGNYTALFNQIKQKKEDLKALEQTRKQAEDERSFLQFALEEIDAIKPNVAERQALAEKLQALEEREKITEHLSVFKALLKGQEGAIGRLREAKQSLRHLQNFLPSNEIERFESSLIELDDLTETILSLKDTMSYSEAELDAMQHKLSSLQRLEKKYGHGSTTHLIEFTEKSRLKLQTLEGGQEAEEELLKEIAQLEQQLFSKAKNISIRRKERAVSLQQEAEKSLKTLEMENCRFVIEITDKAAEDGQKAVGLYGMDNVEFLFAPNVGQPLKPLKAIASGGEASRVLLALKSVLAENDGIDCLIFDEIDTGIGGSAAVAVAKHIQKLSTQKQVLVITHLASIAAAADHQLKIEKTNDGMQTITTVLPIKEESRIKEIARMLSGRLDEVALAHARQLLNDSQRR